MNGNKIINLGAPTASGDIATFPDFDIFQN
jgi:hypothetical protein